MTLEGGEGAGKSTQAALLLAALQRAGISARQTREPGGSPGAEAVRRLLLDGDIGRWDAIGEALLLCAARRDHVAAVIAPALAAGAWVVCDRFADSTIAYQGYGRGMALADLATLQRLTLDGLAPDLTLVFDLPVALGLARAAARPGAADRFERLDRAFHERLRDGYLRIAAEEPQRVAVIAAAADIDTVHRAVLAVMRDRLGIEVV
ncbi:MAG TPA: dTMP kinase [Stellaceae bacterium]|nr:dTMP kinase [Stellaceae bacterium]